MLDFLFRGLTADSARGTALFNSATQEARKIHWYREGQVPDTLDGRFAMLATIVALVMVRLERDGAAGDRVSVALTERFIEVMESEHRELGLGDPALGRKVRRLVGSLARKTDLWRAVAAGGRPWRDAVRESVYKDEPPADAETHAEDALRGFWSGLERAEIAALAEGKIE